MRNETPFLELARLFESLSVTTKKNRKKELISAFLKRLNEEEIQPVISFLTGRIFPEPDRRILDLGGRTVLKIVEDMKQTVLTNERLTILRTSKHFDEISEQRGRGSRTKKRNLARSLLRQATSLERKYLFGILLGELRIGVAEGITMEAIARAASVELGLVRRANMLLDNLGEVAQLSLKDGTEGLKNVSVKLFVPIKPMLAEMEYDLKEVFDRHQGLVGFEYKLDGVRVQVHRKKRRVRIFSRRLTDVTRSIPEIEEIVKKQVFVDEALLDGELVAYSNTGKPLPFQALMRRLKRIHEIDTLAKKVPLRLFLFDILYRNGESLVDRSYGERWEILARNCEPDLLVNRIVTDNTSQAKGFLNAALKDGHEGLLAKSLDSKYSPGKRGKKWLKIKPFETLDLVITAAEWGYGRRRNWLSNYHLAVRNDKEDGYLNVGKTFKGLTDSEFKEMTDRLLNTKIREDEYAVYVKPRIVVEVGFGEIQSSSRYKSGFALRFARIKSIRYDKSPRDADTLSRIKSLFEKQFRYKAKL